MVRLEISKANLRYRTIMAIGNGLTIIGFGMLGLQVYNVFKYGHDNSLTIYIFMFALLIPLHIYNILAKKYKNAGFIELNDNEIVIIDSIGMEFKFIIREFDLFKIRIMGYDGQHPLGDIQVLGKGSDYPALDALTGLGNKVIFSSAGKKYKFNFYIETVENYNELKKLIDTWKQYSFFKFKIMRS